MLGFRKFLQTAAMTTDKIAEQVLYKTEDQRERVRGAQEILNNTDTITSPTNAQKEKGTEEFKVIRKERAYSMQGPRQDQSMDLKQHMEKRPSMNEFELGSKIGEGAYAIVRSCTHKRTQDRIAVKIYDKYKLNDPVKKRSVSREIELLKKFSHPNIVKFYDSIDTNKTINLVMEHAKGRSLYSYLKSKKYRRISENEAKIIFK